MLKAGYNVVVTSWENDADNYGTEVVHVADLVDAKFLKEFAELFSSRNNYNSIGFGNVYEEIDSETAVSLIEAVKNLCQMHPNTEYAQNILEELDSDSKLDKIYVISEEASNLIGTSSNGFLFRVCESVEVLYLDSDPQVIEV